MSGELRVALPQVEEKRQEVSDLQEVLRALEREQRFFVAQETMVPPLAYWGDLACSM